MDLCSHKHDFGISAEWVFFATSYCKVPSNGIGRAVKTTCSQEKPPNVFELSNLRLQIHPRFM